MSKRGWKIDREKEKDENWGSRGSRKEEGIKESDRKNMKREKERK